MQIPVTGAFAAGASTMEEDAPPTVYQTRVSSTGVQDSATPLLLTMRLSHTAVAAISKAQAAGHEMPSIVHGAIRRFDLNELEAFDDASGSMLGLRLPQQTFVFDFRPKAGVLHIHVHRKELPVSRSYGETPMVFAFFIVPANEVVVTRQFFVASKQPKPMAPKPAKVPKRVRPAPPRRPAPAQPTPVEAAINSMLSSAKRSRASGRTDAGTTCPTLDDLLGGDDVLDLPADMHLPLLATDNGGAGAGAGSGSDTSSPGSLPAAASPFLAFGVDGLDSPTVAAGGPAAFSVAVSADTDDNGAAPSVVALPPAGTDDVGVLDGLTAGDLSAWL